MFNKVLVANRGEIAFRIVRACKKFGVRTVSVFSEADSSSLHVKEADESHCLGPAQPGASYLNIEKIVEAAKATDAEAIHPGYGFLSENSRFAGACEQNDLVFIGPTSATLELTENKITLRRLMKNQGIPVVSSVGPFSDRAQLVMEAFEKMSWPVIIKSAYGGGGRGIRVVAKREELESALDASRNEAKISFGREEIYVEQYISRPRHIEFQVLGDHNGNLIHVNERECSIQRRFQKLVEESPSPAVNVDLRRSIGETAIKAMSTVKYHNAGTVEFLMDQAGNFYLNEINSRLQVEHPVTELATGIDLVEQQLRISTGEDLVLTSDDTHIKNHAVECRINAEDPARNFFPSPGKITQYNPPIDEFVRVDSHIYHGYTVPMYYDSLLAKLLACGPTRNEAIEKLSWALNNLVLEGVKTTIPMHKKIVENPSFRRGELSTHFLDDERIVEGLRKDK
ncbi:MAG: acetyl/propionyl/methylcrotonyl-CoA carboxylase subunit alpha [Candidatus Bathyarchaeia archaeon]